MSSKNVYITLLGRSVWALINTYYAVLQETDFRPDEIHVFAEEPFANEDEKVRQGMEILTEDFGFDTKIEFSVVPEADFVKAGLEISSFIRKLKEEGATVAVDITPGRKSMVAGTLLPIDIGSLDHVYYLAIDQLEGVSKPYMMIPHQIQHIEDFIEQAKAEQERRAEE